MADDAAPNPKNGNGNGHDAPVEAPAPSGRLEFRDIQRLAQLMDRHGLHELELEDAGRRIRLKKAGGAETNGSLPAVPAVHVAGAPAAALVPAPVPAPAPGAEIRSPMVGTFYRAASPEAAPFMEVGDVVRRDSVVCIIEAMKVMNEIKSEVDGEILAVLAQNGEAVEFDQPLFLVRPSAAAPPAGA